MIDIWEFELSQTKQVWEECWAVLSIDERQKANTFHRESLQHSYVVTKGVVRKIIGRYLNIHPASIHFCYTPWGKPSVVNYPSCYFNVAHSKNYALCAIGTLAEVGIDLEFITEKINIPELAKHVMAPEELVEFSGLPIAYQHDVFFEMWARKEAFVKCLGKGLHYDLKNCYVGVTSYPVIVEKDDTGYKKREWFIQDIGIHHQYKAAIVVAHHSDVTVQHRHWSYYSLFSI